MTNSNFAQSLRAAWQSLMLSLCVLNRIQFNAPWETRRSTCSDGA